MPTRKILVVDDTKAAGYVLGRLLEIMGQDVRTTDNARSAIESIRHDRPDLVISDIGMPQMDGYELARHTPAQNRSWFAYLGSAHGLWSEPRQRAKAAGFDYHLVKPVSVEALYDLLAPLCGTKEDDPPGDRSIVRQHAGEAKTRSLTTFHFPSTARPIATG